MGNRTRLPSARLGIKCENKLPNDYLSVYWMSDSRNVPLLLQQDALIRKIVDDYVASNEFLQYSVDRIEISRGMGSAVNVKIFSCKPGKMSSKESDHVGQISNLIQNRLVKSQLCSEGLRVNVTIAESFRQEINAKLIAQQIVKLMIDRSNYTQYIRRILRFSGKLVKGIRIELAGRLSGATIARDEVYATGSVRLSSLSRSIDYCFYPACTVKGVCGVKVYIDMGGSRG